MYSLDSKMCKLFLGIVKSYPGAIYNRTNAETISTELFGPRRFRASVTLEPTVANAFIAGYKRLLFEIGLRGRAPKSGNVLSVLAARRKKRRSACSASPSRFGTSLERRVSPSRQVLFGLSEGSSVTASSLVSFISGPTIARATVVCTKRQRLQGVSMCAMRPNRRMNRTHAKREDRVRSCNSTSIVCGYRRGRFE